MNNLPDLPKQNDQAEADFGVEFRRWWEKKRMFGLFELKHTHGAKSLSYKELTAEQMAFNTLAKSSKGVLGRIASGTVGIPDYGGFIGMPTWIVIRYPKAFHIISVETFLLEKVRSNRKSLTEERAKAISTISVQR